MEGLVQLYTSKNGLSPSSSLVVALANACLADVTVRCSLTLLSADTLWLLSADVQWVYILSAGYEVIHAVSLIVLHR